MLDHSDLIRLPIRHTWLGLASLVGFGAVILGLWALGVMI